jgi:hypothetical protein
VGGISPVPFVAEFIGAYQGELADIQNGDMPDHARASEIIEAILSEAIAVLHLPGLAIDKAFDVYELVLGAIQVISGGLEKLGHTNEAVWLQELAGNADFVDSIADNLADKI